jgi:hypothetical protein
MVPSKALMIVLVKSPHIIELSIFFTQAKKGAQYIAFLFIRAHYFGRS